jgi:hypothetical protein
MHGDVKCVQVVSIFAIVDDAIQHFTVTLSGDAPLIYRGSELYEVESSPRLDDSLLKGEKDRCSVSTYVFAIDAMTDNMFEPGR